MASDDKPYTGECLCGAVRFEVHGELTDPHACHCGQCRRQSGHFVVGASADRDQFRLVEDKGLKWFQSSSFARRGFCHDCGSVMFWDGGDDTIGINLGCLDQPTGLKLERHIFIDDKADYYEISDTLPKFAGSDEPIAE